MYVVGCIALAACGRLGFDGFGRTDGGDDSGGDTMPSNVCNRSAIAPEPLTIIGHAFQYLNFVGDLEGLPANMIARSSPLGGVLASTTAAEDGAYQLAIGTGGVPQTVWLDASIPGYFETKYWFDYALEHPIVGTFTPQLRPGDVPIWAAGALNSVYNSGSAVRDDGRGTLIVTVLDCDEQPVPDVTITLDPPLSTPTFVGPSGLFDLSATTTLAPYSQGVFLNASTGAVTVHATHATHAFLPYDVSVSAGEAVSVVVLHTADPS
ncbi:hypothetical protein BH11MYX2_BH11MYX2_12830 [soil metagenome]